MGSSGGGSGQKGENIWASKIESKHDGHEGELTRYKVAGLLWRLGERGTRRR